MSLLRVYRYSLYALIIIIVRVWKYIYECKYLSPFCSSSSAQFQHAFYQRATLVSTQCPIRFSTEYYWVQKTDKQRGRWTNKYKKSRGKREQQSMFLREWKKEQTSSTFAYHKLHTTFVLLSTQKVFCYWCAVVFSCISSALSSTEQLAKRD